MERIKQYLFSGILAWNLQNALKLVVDWEIKFWFKEGGLDKFIPLQIDFQNYLVLLCIHGSLSKKRATKYTKYSHFKCMGTQWRLCCQAAIAPVHFRLLRRLSLRK